MAEREQRDECVINAFKIGNKQMAEQLLLSIRPVSQDLRSPPPPPSGGPPGPPILGKKGPPGPFFLGNTVRGGPSVRRKDGRT